jgi:hypothetical protein
VYLVPIESGYHISIYLSSMDLSYKMFVEIPLVVRHHWNSGNINWLMMTYSLWAHVVALIGVFKIMECRKETLMWAFLLWPIR